MIALRIDNKEYTGFKTVSAMMHVRAFAFSFKAKVTQPHDNFSGFDLTTGQAFSLTHNGNIVMTGYIDEINDSFDAKTITFDLSGRSKTAQLVDSAAIFESGEFNDMSLSDIASALCKPFNISVLNLSDDSESFTKVRIEQGESCHDLLERLARQRGVLLTTNANSDLVITTAGDTLVTPAIEVGVNVKSGGGTDSIKPRASVYIIKGSTNGGAGWDADQSVGNAVQINDPDISLYRPRIIVCEGALSERTAIQRGQWQRCKDLGDSNSRRYTLTGWMNDAAIWRPNTQVRIKDSIKSLDEKRLINSVELMFDEGGETVNLSVIPPEALLIPKEQKAEEDILWVS